MAQCVISSCGNHKQSLLHKFPVDRKLRIAWFKCLLNQRLSNAVQTPYLCERHFRRSDYLFSTKVKGRKKLKPNTVPCIFEYQDLCNIKPVVSLTTKSKRTNPSDVVDFSEFKKNFRQQVSSYTLSQYTIKETDDFVSFYIMSFTRGVPVVKVNVSITKNLRVAVYIANEKVYPCNLFWVLSKDGKLTKYTQLDILLRYYKDGNQVFVQGINKYINNLEMIDSLIDQLCDECYVYEGERSSKMSYVLSIVQSQVNFLFGEKESEDLIEFSEELLGISEDAYGIAKTMLKLPEEDPSHCPQHIDKNIDMFSDL
ncbi:uncharacterized protein LOC129802334 [Phlebotomus papatasi]|uniref:uncharacterized protein LOC129802334 n=1 Tax=Phlebotomus papatasi TaxID=29031 RepID=UPI0024843639|nr:uncharacterized protein LOC129802334 [Phlebotomus papatasi]